MGKQVVEMEEKEQKEGHVEVGVEMSERGLSMKAKGTVVGVLLGLTILGIIFVAYLMATSEHGAVLMLPLLFLLFISYQLINVLHAILKTGLIIQTGWDD